MEVMVIFLIVIGIVLLIFFLIWMSYMGFDERISVVVLLVMYWIV